MDGRRRGSRTAAALAVLGLVASALVVVVAGTSGPAGAVDRDEIDVTELSGTLSNGVAWEANGPPNTFGAGSPPLTRTITFSQPVHVEFSLVSVQCPNEGVQLPEGVAPISLHPNHAYDPVARTLFATPGTSEDDVSSFQIYGFVDVLEVTAVGTEACNRALAKVSASVPVPFECEVSTIFLAQGQPATQLNLLEYGGGEGTFVPLGDPRSLPYNAVGYHDGDGLLYGSDVSGHLLVIDSAGDVIDLGAATPDVGPNHNVGAIGPDGALYTMWGNGTTLHRVDVHALTSSPIPLTAPPQVADLTFVGDLLWGFDHGSDAFVRVDPATGQVDKFGTDLVSSGQGVGAAWTFANGNLGLSDNQSGTIYQVRIEDPTGPSPTFEVLSAAPGPPNSFNDGTSCEGPPTDLVLEKSVSPDLIVPGGTLTWTITIRNDGPGASSGYVVTDALPAGVTELATDTPGCAVDGQVVTCTGAALGVGGQREVVITGIAPDDAASVTNGAVVVANEEDPDLSNNEDQATARRPVGLCSARTLGLPLGIDLGQANPAETPCATDDELILRLGVTIGPNLPKLLSALESTVTVHGVSATTTDEPTRHSAEAAVASASIRIPTLALAIDVTGLHSTAASSLTSCAAPPVVESESRVATIRINGVTIPVGSAQLSIPLLVGALHVNQNVVVGGTVVRRTVFLDLPGTALDVVIGETKAGITC